MRYLLFIFIPFVSFGQTITLTNSDVAAFYGAEGHGRNATGGRGQTVYQVTNLNDSGAGSFRDAVSSGNRYIIFRVGGTIEITSRINVGGDNITVAGETAPGDGIAIHGNGIDISGQENIIFRHIRVRQGDGASSDALRLLNTTGSAKNDFMFDHLSVSWGADENFGIGGGSGGPGVNNITVSNSIISESFNSYGMLIFHAVYDLSVIKNLFVNNNDRNPRNTSSQASFEVINNVVYRYSLAAIGAVPQTTHSIIGNVLLQPTGVSGEGIKLTACTTDNCPPSGIDSGAGTTYFIDDNTENGVDADSPGGRYNDAAESGTRVVNSGYTPLPNAEVENHVLSNAGARRGISGIDALDDHMVDDVDLRRAGGSVSAESGTTGLPVLAGGTPFADSDGDGLSDEFETVNGGSISPNTRPVTATLIDGTIIDQSAVTAGSRYTYMDIQNGELAGDWGSGTPGGGGGGGSSSPDGTKNGTSAMLIAH